MVNLSGSDGKSVRSATPGGHSSQQFGLVGGGWRKARLAALCTHRSGLKFEAELLVAARNGLVLSHFNIPSNHAEVASQREFVGLGGSGTNIIAEEIAWKVRDCGNADKEAGCGNKEVCVARHHLGNM